MPGGDIFQKLSRHDDRVDAVAFGPDGRLLATGSGDRSVRLWLRRDNKFEQLLALGFSGRVIRLRFSPDGKNLATLVENETGVRLWHLDQLKQALGPLRLDW